MYLWNLFGITVIPPVNNSIAIHEYVQFCIHGCIGFTASPFLKSIADNNDLSLFLFLFSVSYISTMENVLLIQIYGHTDFAQSLLKNWYNRMCRIGHIFISVYVMLRCVSLV